LTETELWPKWLAAYPMKREMDDKVTLIFNPSLSFATDPNGIV